MRQVCLFLFLAIMSVSCSDDDDTVDGQIIQQYIYKYVEQSDQTLAGASFLDNANPSYYLELKSPASVTINDDPLNYNDLMLSFPYFKTYLGKIDTGNFKLVDYDYQIYSNMLDLGNIEYIGVPSTLDSIETFSDFSFTWLGAPLASGELVVLVFNTTTGSRSFNFSDVGSNTIYLYKHDWASVGPGEGSISIERQKSYNLQQSTGGGGAMNLVYSSGENEVIFY